MKKPKKFKKKKIKKILPKRKNNTIEVSILKHLKTAVDAKGKVYAIENFLFKNRNSGFFIGRKAKAEIVNKKKDTIRLFHLEPFPE